MAYTIQEQFMLYLFLIIIIALTGLISLVHIGKVEGGQFCLKMEESARNIIQLSIIVQAVASILVFLLFLYTIRLPSGCVDRRFASVMKTEKGAICPSMGKFTVLRFLALGMMIYNIGAGIYYANVLAKLTLGDNGYCFNITEEELTNIRRMIIASLVISVITFIIGILLL
jgi:hypothetical protein